ncbi:MAG: hypothetical protein JWQ84_1312 [Mucilaginibacter sp.]|nr:hypothetical protein [Mucilaginibacter sp.]MDB5139371.1 hypothetical protein [Mucilaginibacter sp.]
MHLFKPAKIYFCFAVMLLVAKPFLGFTMFSRIHPPLGKNILVKAFTKRTLEYSENSRFNMSAVQKKLAEPGTQLFLRFSFFLGILFPILFNIQAGISARFLRRLQLNLHPDRGTWLINSALLI